MRAGHVDPVDGETVPVVGRLEDAAAADAVGFAVVPPAGGGSGLAAALRCLAGRAAGAVSAAKPVVERGVEPTAGDASDRTG